jgi:hypothetical protein
VSAVARNGDVPLNMNFAHGWPILSLGVVANTSVLDGSGAASVAPGRAA